MLLSFSACAFFIGAIFLMPAYRLAEEKTASARKSIDIAKSLSAARAGGNPEFVIKEIQKKLDLFATEKNKATPSALFQTILNARPSGVRISGFTYVEKGDGSDEIEVRGQALTRETLLSFVSALERGTVFGKVSVPVSNFVQDVNLDFSLLLSTKTVPS